MGQGAVPRRLGVLDENYHGLGDHSRRAFENLKLPLDPEIKALFNERYIVSFGCFVSTSFY